MVTARNIIVYAIGAVLIAGSVWWVLAGSPAAQVQGESVQITLGDAKVDAEIVATPEARTKGLSGRESLAEDEGMLFIFDTDDVHSFWMKDMLISIDMIWLTADKRVVHIEANATPESYPASFGPHTPTRYVLEVPAGWAARHGVTINSFAAWE
jgi:hypothetical protein